MGTSETEFDELFPTAELAIKKAKQLFNEYKLSKTKEVYSIVNVWAAVRPVSVNEHGSKAGERIFNLYKDQETAQQNQ